MFRIVNPKWLDQIFQPNISMAPSRESKRIPFFAGNLQKLRQLTEREWEESKRKALRWQSEGK